MSDDALIAELERNIEDERARMHRFLALLGEADRRRTLEKLGYASTYDYCTRRLKLSEGEAYRRIQAARAAKIRPEILSSMSEGLLTLSAVSKIAPLVRRPDAPEIISRVEGKTTREIDEILAPLCPEPPRRDFIREIIVATPYQDEARVQFSFQGSRELRAAIERLRQILSHRYPGGALDSILMEAVREYLERHDPIIVSEERKAPPPGSASIPAAARRRVWSRDGGRCVFIGPRGERCQSRHFLELDHIRPRALGGSDDSDNLRLLCRAHNDAERRRVLGEGSVSGYCSDGVRPS